MFLTGTQALVRLLLMQRRRDQAAGLNTAAFVSGYRGDPRWAWSTSTSWKAKKFLAGVAGRVPAGDQRGLLAATACNTGTQRVALGPRKRTVEEA